MSTESKSVTVFTLRVEVPTIMANSVRRYLTTPTLGLGGNLVEQTRELLENNGQNITNRRIVWEGKLVGS